MCSTLQDYEVTIAVTEVSQIIFYITANNFCCSKVFILAMALQADSLPVQKKTLYVPALEEIVNGKFNIFILIYMRKFLICSAK